jgi:hypothetical protein
MWATEIEKSGSGESSEEKSSLSLWYLGAMVPGESLEELISHVASLVPPSFSNTDFKTLKWRPIDSSAGLAWEFEAEYSDQEEKKKEQKPDDEGEITFDSTGGREKIWYSKETSNSIAIAGQTAPDFKGGINVSKTGVEGVDIVVPVFKFSITRSFRLADLRLDAGKSWLDQWWSYTGYVNSTELTLSYRGISLTFKRRELLFTGVRGGQSGKENVKLTFSFEASKTGNDVSVGNGAIIVPIKRGWDYLWVDYFETTSNNALIQSPRAAYVERVYNEIDFRTLNF